MWFDHQFSQRNRTTERTVWAGVAGNREVGGGGGGNWTKVIVMVSQYKYLMG